MKPYYEEDGKCHCQCGRPVGIGRLYISGHNLRTLKKTAEHLRKIGEGQRRAWQTKRVRSPVGSKWIDRDGYVRVKVSEPCDYWRPEHLIVAEQKLGRALRPGEIVHHVNLVRDDNADTNIYVCMSRSHHNRVHSSLDAVTAALIRDGVIEFDHTTGEYRRCR